MEKKQYIIPTTEIVEMEIETLMEIGSATLDSDTEIDDSEEIGSREIFWD